MWLDSLGDEDPLTPRPALGGRLDVDVAIVGAGFTGLWTAYYLRRADPTLRIAVLEAEIAGFGASGRNGGWCSALLPMGLDAMASNHERGGRAAAVAMAREMQRTVDEVGRAAAAEGIDCHFVKGGYLHLATAPPHVARIQAEIRHERSWGFGDEDIRWLDRREARGRIAADGVLGAAFTPHCAAIQPARLARGLARVVEGSGVAVYEQTPVTAIAPGRVETAHGAVRAEVVVRATEGFTGRLPGLRRAIVPIYSLMIATEPLPPDVWAEIGWAARETCNDARHLIIYAQRTADGRIAFGGRGAPYHLGSRIRPSFDQNARVRDDLHRVLCSLFPAVSGARITHHWGGPLGAPRDWHCSVGLDRATGLAWAGGYVGDGVATTNLAGRTLADLVTGADSDLVRLPWVEHRSPNWEPEPLRWIGINAMLRVPLSADAAEARTGRPARRREAVMRRILGS